jgi:ankyrin repeat protein
LFNFWLTSVRDINAKDQDGYSLLHAAARKNHHTVGRYLLDAGANIRILAGNGGTAGHFASRRVSVEIAKVLVAAARAANEES